MNNKTSIEILLSIISLLVAIISLFQNNLFFLFLSLLVIFLLFTILTIKNPKLIILTIIFVLLSISAFGLLMNEVVGVSYIIQIDHDGEYAAGFGSEHLTKEGFTGYSFEEFDLGDTSYVDVGAKKSTDNSKAIKLKILKKRMINMGSYEKIAENITSAPYGNIVLNIET